MKVEHNIYENQAIERAQKYPTFRYMGSKHRLLSWIHDCTNNLSFETVLDGFSGSGAVSYLFKQMGKEVTSNDFLYFSHTISKATIENNNTILEERDLELIFYRDVNREKFIQNTFRGIFFTEKDLDFLDSAYFNINQFNDQSKKYLALACLLRACIKKQPRGVFTVSGDLSNYNDGRRDLKLSIEEHFLEQTEIFNELVFDNGNINKSTNHDIFAVDNPHKYDLVYLDPPYVPRSDDNCYIKRYHFLEGLSKYWKDEEILYNTKVKKIKKRFTPFSYRSKALDAFDLMFNRFKHSIIVLSYSSNAYPDLDTLYKLLKLYKRNVEIIKKDHKYHFGNHKSAKRSNVEEYLIIGS